MSALCRHGAALLDTAASHRRRVTSFKYGTTNTLYISGVMGVVVTDK